jgi:hypothetical protein
MLKRLRRGIYAFLAIAFCFFVGTHPLYAVTQSTNYKFDETAIGSGGLNQSSSANYIGRDSVGDIGVGTSASGNYQVAAGSTTTNDPALSVSIGGSSVGFNSFSASAATTTTANFTVLNYTSYGYVVQLVGNPPSNGSTTISAMTTTGPSVAGTSQFGINLVANTSPVSVGANPNTGQFGYGSASANYGTSNQYRYVSGETIAQSTKSSGLTTYTITYLINVDPLTPGGIYTSNQTLIITGTY